MVSPGKRVRWTRVSVGFPDLQESGWRRRARASARADTLAGTNRDKSRVCRSSLQILVLGFGHKKEGVALLPHPLLEPPPGYSTAGAGASTEIRPCATSQRISRCAVDALLPASTDFCTNCATVWPDWCSANRTRDLPRLGLGIPAGSTVITQLGANRPGTYRTLAALASTAGAATGATSTAATSTGAVVTGATSTGAALVARFLRDMILLPCWPEREARGPVRAGHMTNQHRYNSTVAFSVHVAGCRTPVFHFVYNAPCAWFVVKTQLKSRAVLYTRLTSWRLELNFEMRPKNPHPIHPNPRPPTQPPQAMHLPHTSQCP